jgi:hypothetical protein
MVKPESENLKKLREIIKEIESKNFILSDDTNYHKLTENIDTLIHKEMGKINCESNKDCKLKSYEALFTSILGLIEGTKHLL